MERTIDDAPARSVAGGAERRGAVAIDVDADRGRRTVTGRDDHPVDARGLVAAR
ncbi:hypothetical protein [Haloterrigena gelatinilytica]|uniref:hypothetical protein n=1 Tax=Haloterrigena gelatinilytica TaxID=2741724 RepID=UPI001C2E750B|nr:hypothetical protein [Haloterrigena gelatinilytica]